MAQFVPLHLSFSKETGVNFAPDAPEDNPGKVTPRLIGALIPWVQGAEPQALGSSRIRVICERTTFDRGEDLAGKEGSIIEIIGKSYPDEGHEPTQDRINETTATLTALGNIAAQCVGGDFSADGTVPGRFVVLFDV